jgi:cytochrome o ubiquinol oxidase subunit 2
MKFDRPWPLFGGRVLALAVSANRVFVKRTIASLLALSLPGCGGGVLDPRGPVGASEKLILIDSMTIMLAIVVPVILATVAFAWWFRASNSRATYRPNWDFSGSLELIIWAIPALVITFLGGIAWFGSQALDPYRPLVSKLKPIEVEAVSLDWKWLFIYPDEGIATVNQLVLPAGTPVHFKITSASVWNTFFVPQLGSMIYSMAGMTTQLNLQADTPGTFLGLSGQFSGDKFSDMHFDVRAVDGEAFHHWESGAALDRGAYARLAQTEDTSPVMTYKGVDPTLFGAIVAGTAPESAGAPQITNAPP